MYSESKIRQAHQRASVKWLLSKSFSNSVPDNLKEPFYRDHENQERLKPQVALDMGGATLYCMTLSNLYSDPNYQNLNHSSILQTLIRKGLPVADTSDMPITETVLMQTNPIRINAHISVIESLMKLYAKEILSIDRVSNALRRISANNYQQLSGQNCEQYLFAWLSHICVALKRRITKEVETNMIENDGTKLIIPDFPPLHDFQDICNCTCLALLISYYCPEVVPWTVVRINYSEAFEDTMYNCELVSNFSQKYLPYSVFHVNPEELTIMRGPMKLHLVVLLADLFNLFEILPLKSTCFPEEDNDAISTARSEASNYYGISTRRGVTIQPVTTIPDLRKESDKQSGSPSKRRVTNSENRNLHTGFSQTSTISTQLQNNGNTRQLIGDQEGFVVHKSRTIATLSSLRPPQHFKQKEPLVPARLRQSKEKTNMMESKADERGDNVPAGRPSNWEQNRKPSYAGRRSRRNSSSEESQLTIEHFGGSQDQLNVIEHNIDRECGGKLYCTNAEPAVALRSSIVDARGTLQLAYDTDSGSEKQDCETEKNSLRQSKSSENVFLHASNVNSNNTNNSLSAQKPHSRIEKDYDDVGELCYQEAKTSFGIDLNNSISYSSEEEYIPKTKTPNSSSTNASQQNTILTKSDQIDPFEEETRSLFNVSKLATIRLKLEEKRRRIEQDKSNLEMVITRHQEMQPHSSQQQLAGNYQNSKSQQHFGSTPHLPQSFNLSNNIYSSHPSRDHYHQYLPQSIPFINEHYVGQGHYVVNPQPEISPLIITHTHINPSHSIYNENDTKYNYKQQLDPYNQCQYYSDYQQQKCLSHPQEYDKYSRTQSPNLNASYSFDSTPQSQQSLQRTWIHSAHSQKVRHHLPQPSTVDVNTWKYNKIPKAETCSLYNNKTSSDCNLEQYRISYEYEKKNVAENLLEVHSSPQQFTNQINHHLLTQQPLSMTNLKDNHSPDIIKSSQITARKITTDDMMAPQSICFIGDEEDVDEIERNIIESMQSTRLSEYNNYEILQQLQKTHNRDYSLEDERNQTKINKLNITSGNMTYRIPSPSRPSLHANSFQSPHNGSYTNEKGFYISFDDDGPKRPKPLLRTNRTPRKSLDNVDNQSNTNREFISKLHKKFNENDFVAKEFIDTSNYDSSKATYNKYTNPPIQLIQLPEVNSSYSQTSNVQNSSDRRHLEDVTNQQQSPTQRSMLTKSPLARESNEKVLVIGADVTNLDPHSVDEMEKRKEKIMLLSLQRRQQQEEARARKEAEVNQRREREREKEEIRSRKKEEQMARRAAILEQYRLKKAIEEAEREGKLFDQSEHSIKQHSQNVIMPRLRQQRVTRPRPKTIHVDARSVDISESSSISSRGKKGSSTNLTGSPDEYPSTSSTPIGRRGSYKMSRDTDSGLDRATPPRRAPSPGMILSSRHMPSPSGPGSLPPGLVSRRRGDDVSSDISLHPHSVMEYSGPKLYKQPEAKSNRGIILNAVEYCVFPGVVNRDAKQKVLEKIARSEAKHFLILFRDVGCQFRALYSYSPERNYVIKLYGTGPSQVDEAMFDKFFK